MITDVPGVMVGHAQRVGDGWATGVTVVVPPPGTVGGVDVRGGGPATHETDALAPGTLVDTVDAVVLAGGSAYGLVSVHGVQRWCEEQGRGFRVAEDLVVPVVPAAALFDLGRGGDPTARPDAEMGYTAATSARPGPPELGCVGAGTGAVCAGGQVKGGVGSASVRLAGGVVVGALAVVNAAGGLRTDTATPSDPGVPPRGASGPLNTTLVVVATNARLDVAEATRLASSSHDGLARALDPVHALVDGDVVFALSTGEIDSAAAGPEPTDGQWPGAARVQGLVALQAAGALAVERAVRDGVLRATVVPGVQAQPLSGTA